MLEKEGAPEETQEQAAARRTSFASEMRAMKAECPEAFDRLRELLRKNHGCMSSNDVPPALYPNVRTWYALFRKGAAA